MSVCLSYLMPTIDYSIVQFRMHTSLTHYREKREKTPIGQQHLGTVRQTDSLGSMSGSVDRYSLHRERSSTASGTVDGQSTSEQPAGKLTGPLRAQPHPEGAVASHPITFGSIKGNKCFKYKRYGKSSNKPLGFISPRVFSR